jgi:hypothetical protein
MLLAISNDFFILNKFNLSYVVFLFLDFVKCPDSAESGIDLDIDDKEELGRLKTQYFFMQDQRVIPEQMNQGVWCD